MKIANIQLEIKDNETKQQRIERVVSKLNELRGYDLITLPEVWATGYFSFDKYREEAEPIDGDFTKTFSEQAKRLNAMIFAGSFIEEKNGNLYNTSILFDTDGTILSTYRKVHLFRYGSKEGELLTAGEEISVVDTKFGKIGLSTCYDMRFPELYRKQVDQGVEIILVTAAWPVERVEHWNLFNRVRALENQCFLVSNNCVGTTSGVTLGGNSQVVDPWGTVVSIGSTEEEIVKAEIDTELLVTIREKFPQLKHRVLIEKF